MAKSQIGLIGLAVMGENLALNIERNGFPISVFNRTYEKTEKLINGRAKGKNMTGTKTIEEFVDSLEKPRRIILLVKAGKPVDAVIDQLLPLLDKGDILIDGGNSHFADTRRRHSLTPHRLCPGLNDLDDVVIEFPSFEFSTLAPKERQTGSRFVLEAELCYC